MEIDDNKIRLELASTAVKASYIEALHEGFRRGAGDAKTPEEIQEIEQGFQAYIDEIHAPKTGTFTLPNGDEIKRVPDETLWLICDDIFIGEVSFRLELSAFLEQYGGHVGYGIRPSLQGRGYATRALEMIRERAAQKGMDQLLLTCSPDNPASEKVIVKNGGVHQDTLEKPYGMEVTKRFWVPTAC